ncbi:class I SAM-dependent methyltransferase [Streptomyces iconiensis]|uniref:Class I SAM-dependent methyltransferase n=1 Tax=Streptomyces iconiensis TaxID=1384038 RepID=A0ABT7A983_9ACTN|nr:class I SAM-dependent methyltransferase [Streptomyces iconiensis]MDJ1137911.1 class I SAM-dependent methyltransferase [Streptomyces iconiensis]
MHPEAHAGLARMLADSGLTPDAPWRVLDLGGRNINGSIRALLPAAEWTGCDIEPGPGVDLLHDCTTPWPAHAPQFDVVVCTEVLEHVERWPLLLATCAQALVRGGPELLLVTCASDGRPPHGAAGAPQPAAGEWYRNVPPLALNATLGPLFEIVVVTYQAVPGDAYARAQRVIPT